MRGQAVKEVVEVGGLTSLKQVTKPIEIKIICHSRLRKWAFDNAYTLIFLASLFVVTWVLMLVIHLKGGV